MRLRVPIALALLAVLAACSSAKPRPTGAGSTSVLRLLRDWRGVWKGQARDSPMGAMTYTVYVEPLGEALQVRLARQSDPDLENMRHVYELQNFVRGTPRIRYSLSQRNATQQGEVVYRADLSTDTDAVFCSEENGCDHLQLTLSQLDERALEFRTQVHEAFHSRMIVRYASAEIPREAADEAEAPSSRLTTKKVQPKDPSGEPIDKDLYLEEHLDKDVGEPGGAGKKGAEKSGMEDW